MAEVGVSRSGGHNEHVIRDTSLAYFDLPSTPIDLCYSPEQNRRVALSPQNGADRHCDLGRREPGGGDLIKQRLKEVIIPSVDDGNVDGGAGERLGGTQSGEPRTNNYHLGPCGSDPGGL